MKSGQKWTRVTGPDSDSDNKELRERNKNTMESEFFKELCSKAGVEVTKRQASRYNNKQGIVYKYGRTEQ
jgi:hypothetical protein